MTRISASFTPYELLCLQLALKVLINMHHSSSDLVELQEKVYRLIPKEAS